MKVQDKVVVVTGAGSGIGRALCRRFAAEGAKTVVVSDRDGALAQSVASEFGGLAFKTDVANEDEIVQLVERTIEKAGPIDLFCSNAGIIVNGGPEVPDSDWNRIWQINVLSHVYAARAVLPGMLERGQGYLLQTASAAGLLTQIGSAPYSVTKHAAVGFAEWLSITYAANGIKVSCLCPQGVRTDMLNLAKESIANHLRESAIDAEDVAESVIAGLDSEKFLILPHAEVADYFRHKGEDYERWLRGMRRLQDKFGADL